jgi:hypothetical protein
MTEPTRSPKHREMTLADVQAVSDLEQRVYPFPWSMGIFKDCLRAGRGGFCVMFFKAWRWPAPKWCF